MPASESIDPVGQGVSDMRGFMLSRAAARCLLLSAVLSVPAVAQKDNSYTVQNLVSDGAIDALHVDTNLVNAWGIARSAMSPWWVANANTGTSTLYNGMGTPQTLIVQVPGAPTGIVFNGSMDFVITDGTASGPAFFIFASLSGTISGWNPTVPSQPSTQAFVAVDNSGSAVYTGLAIATTPAGGRLYAADFAGAKVDVFDESFDPVVITGAFVDPGIRRGLPFGIQTLNGQVYVTYAMPSPAGPAMSGRPRLRQRLRHDGDLRRASRVAGFPERALGPAIAPEGFGRFSGDLLIGNFGNGRINAFDAQTFEPRGHLKTANHSIALVVDGLWGIGFGNGANAGRPPDPVLRGGTRGRDSGGLLGPITFDE